MTREWYFQMMGQEIGPLSAAEFKAKVSTGQIQPDTLVRKGPEGKWVFASLVKGLFAPKPETAPPVPVVLTPAVIPKPPSSAHGTTPTQPYIPNFMPTTVPLSIPFETDGDSEGSASLEFYDFVGFREAITARLYDAIKEFAADRGVTLAQLNRQALANFIRRPELGCNLVIESVKPIVSNTEGTPTAGLPSVKANSQVNAFQVRLCNCGGETISVTDAMYIPKSIEIRNYEPPPVSEPREEEGVVSVRLRPLAVGKPIRMKLDVTLRPKSKSDVVLWFYGNADEALLDLYGQLVVGRGEEIAMSDFFTISATCEIPTALA